jgi:hypothetical protein
MRLIIGYHILNKIAIGQYISFKMKALVAIAGKVLYFFERIPVADFKVAAIVLVLPVLGEGDFVSFHAIKSC